MVRILDKRGLRAKGIPYANAHLLRLERAEKFPPRFSLSENRVGWLEADIDAWIMQRIEASAEQRASMVAKGQDEAPKRKGPPKSNPRVALRSSSPTQTDETPLREDASPRRRRSGHD